jgi:hypothetical protein
MLTATRLASSGGTRGGRGPYRSWTSGASGVYPSNVATVPSVNLSPSDSPALASSTILTATSSITGVEPVSSKRAHARLDARFIASTRR